MDLLDELQTRLVCGDGAMGTMLLEDGIPLERCLEELCISEPERVSKIHQAYVAAGARVIETNTFGASRARLDRFGFGDRTHEINAAAAALARQAVKGKDVCVAGSVGPLGVSADEAITQGIDRAEIFHEQVALEELVVRQAALPRVRGDGVVPRRRVPAAQQRPLFSIGCSWSSPARQKRAARTPRAQAPAACSWWPAKRASARPA